MKPHLITILVLDDEDIIRAIGVRTLKHAGYRVLDAKGGQEAIKTAKEHIGPIRLLLTDIVMWKENGRQVADAISPSRPTMKVLYMSAFVGHASDLLEKNASFIAKPFKPSALLDAVQSTLASTVRNQQMRRRLA